MLVQEWTHKSLSYPIAILPNDQLIVVAGGSNMVIYTMQGTRVNMVAIVKPIQSMAFSPNGKKLTCGTDDDIRIYNINNSQLTLGLLRGHKGLVHSVLWSRSGSRLFSGSWDYMICCWNSNTGEQIGQPWTGHTNWICSLCLLPDRSILASASLNKTACFWDASSGQPIGQHLHISRFRFCNRHIVAKIMTAFDTVIHSYSGFYILHHSQSHYIMG